MKILNTLLIISVFLLSCSGHPALDGKAYSETLTFYSAIVESRYYNPETKQYYLNLDLGDEQSATVEVSHQIFRHASEGDPWNVYRNR